MRKIIRRVCLFLILFGIILGGAITYNWHRNRKTVTYINMQKASLPVVELSCGEDGSNRLHGYLDEMDCKSMRQVITPLSDRRQVTITVETNGMAIDQAIYQLRSTDGTRLVEDGILDKWQENSGIMTQELQLANLMEDGREYTLILMLQSGENTVRYYSRVIYMEENHTGEMVSFIREFSKATYSDDPKMIINYLQPNDTMGTDDLSYINIHSRYGMFTWANLQPTLAGDVRTEITELSDSQLTASLYYPMALTYGDVTKQYEVKENFVVRFRNDTLYLLDYERYMTEPFSVSNMQFDNGNIWLGATSEKSSNMHSPDENVQAFIYQNQLWIYDSSSETVIPVFSYRDGTDERSALDHHTIELVRVTNEGNVDFVVYGYHNRGVHEGHVGAAFYRYIKAENRMDELFYVPAAISEELLQTRMGGLAYVSETDLLYFLYGSTIYSVDLTSQEKMELATLDSSAEFFRNKAENAVAWIEGEPGQTNEIVVMNLENGKLFRIEAQEGEFLEIQGFIGMDLIYGVGRTADSGILSGTQEVAPMYRLCFATVGNTLEESGSYEQAGLVILETEIEDNSIEIIRANKNGAAYEPASNDQVFLNVREQTTSLGRMKSRQSEGFLKECYLTLGIDPSRVHIQTESCSYEESDESYILNIGQEDHWQPYYAYGGGGLLGAYSELAEAIQAAYDTMGCVTDENQNYIWTRRTRDLYKNLTLEPEICESESLSLSVSLQMLLTFEGVTDVDSDRMLREGQSVYEILSSLSEGRALDLEGCTVSQVLYYIHMGHPVLAQTGDYSAVLIIGYETKGITVYNPYNGETTQMTMEDAESYFDGLGSRFFGCL